MQITFEIDGARAEGTIDGKPFVVSRKGIETSINIGDEETFGGMIAPKMLEFCGTLMDGINVIVDETDGLDVWTKLDDELAEQVYDALM